MTYIDDSLLPNEHVAFRARLSRAIFLGPAFLFAFGLLLSLGGREGAAISVIFLLVGISSGVTRYINFVTSEFAVTDKRVIFKIGVLRRRTLELQLSKLEAVTVNQGIIGRLFGYGDIIVTGTGGTKEPFKMIDSVLDFRRAVQEATA